MRKRGRSGERMQGLVIRHREAETRSDRLTRRSNDQADCPSSEGDQEEDEGGGEVMEVTDVIKPDQISAGPCPETEDITILLSHNGRVYQIVLTPSQAVTLMDELRFSLNNVDSGEYDWSSFGEVAFELKDDISFENGGK